MQTKDTLVIDSGLNKYTSIGNNGFGQYLIMEVRSLTIANLWSIIVAIAAGIASIAAAWKVIEPAILKPIKELDNKITKLASESQKSDADIKTQLSGIDQQVGTMQRQKMMWAYSYYGVQKHPISIETKSSLQAMYDQYTANGKHNHIPQDFKKKIDAAPLQGTVR